MERMRLKSVTLWFGIAALATAGSALTACHGSHATAADWASTVLPAQAPPGSAALARGQPARGRDAGQVIDQ